MFFLRGILFFYKLYYNYFRFIVYSRYFASFAKTAAYDKSAVVHTRGVFRKYSLSGSIYSHAKEAPLSSVSVSRECKVYRKLFYIFRIIFGMVRKKYLKAVQRRKFRGEKRIGSGRRKKMRLSLARGVPRGKSAYIHTLKANAAVVKQNGTAFVYTGNKVAREFSFVVSYGAKSRLQLRTQTEKLKAPFIYFVIVYKISSDQNRVRAGGAYRFYYRSVRRVVKIGNKCKGQRSFYVGFYPIFG